VRKLMWFTIGFGTASAYGIFCNNSWLLQTAAAFALLAFICLALRRWKIHFRIGCAICLGIAVGLSVFNVFDTTVLENARTLDGRMETVTIETTDYSYATDRGCAVDGNLELRGYSYKVRVYLNEEVQLQPGCKLEGDFSFRMTFKSTDVSLNNAGKGIFLFANQNGALSIVEPTQHKWTDYPAIWRQQLKDKINAAFPEDTEGFARALLLGDTTGIDYETDTAMKISGIRHVIAVSGLHVSVVFGLLYLLAGKKRFLTALIGIPAVILFAALAGFTPSVTRACIMQILMMVALLFEKDYDPPTALAFAVLVMLGINPMAICSVSFQLSAGCMIGMFLFSERIYNWMMNTPYFGKGKLSTLIARSVSITLSTMITTAPLSAYYFGTVSLIGVVTNLITLWSITLVFYGIMLVCALSYIFVPASQFIGYVLSGLIRFVKAAASAMAAVPMSAVYTKSVYIVIWMAFAYLLLMVYLLIRKKPAKLFTALVLLGLCVAVSLSWIEPMMYECHVTMLDVGQGQAILLQSKGKTFLVDCGSDYNKGAADTTAETLLSRGIRKLDGIILTHYDGDHCGGLPYLLTRISAENLFLPNAQDGETVQTQLLSVSDGSLHTVREDLKLSYDNVEITIFAPVSYNSGNESSMCVLFQTENCDILIVGDRSERTERILVSQYDLPKLDVLVAGHHGSKTSTSMELLNATMPEYVFISVGEGNPYGHPAEETIARLLEYGCQIFRTDQCGTVIFRR